MSNQGKKMKKYLKILALTVTVFVPFMTASLSEAKGDDAHQRQERNHHENDFNHDGKNNVTQFVYTSDAHYGITRGALDGSGVTVDAQSVNQALVSAINELPAVILPCNDGGVNACEPISTVDFVAETGDIANRMESSKNIQSAAASWKQFNNDYLNGLTLRDRENKKTPMYLVPGNHDVTNAIGFYKTMSPLFDATSYVNIFNLMMEPCTPLTNVGFIGTTPDAATAATSYASNKVRYSKDMGGVHFVFIGMWPDRDTRAWMDTDLARVCPKKPVIIFTHDEPNIETKHLMNPNTLHTINSTDKFENLVLGENNGLASVTSVNEDSTDEQNALVKWLKNHTNVVAYFHGNSNYNEYYSYTGPNGDISLNTFRVDSPMKGNYSSVDPSQLSFQVISIDPTATEMTVREYLWNTKTWGASTTVSLTPRSL